MKKKFKAFEDKDIYEISTDGNGVKQIHIMGFFWVADDGKRIKTTEYTFAIISIEDLLRLKTNPDYENDATYCIECEILQGVKQYDYNVKSKSQAEERFAHYFSIQCQDGRFEDKEPKPLLFNDITMDTPDGYYYNGTGVVEQQSKHR